MTTLPVPTEREEAKVLVAYLRVRGYKFTHIANETGAGRGARFQGIRNKQAGTSSGFPDYLIIVAGHLVAIELKRVRGSSTSMEQKEWLRQLNAAGVPTYIAKGAQAAIDIVESYRNGTPVEPISLKINTPRSGSIF